MFKYQNALSRLVYEYIPAIADIRHFDGQSPGVAAARQLQAWLANPDLDHRSLAVTPVMIRETGPDRYEIAALDGEVLASGIASPEGHACAVLDDRSVTGFIATCWPDKPYPSLLCGIERLAARYHQDRKTRMRALPSIAPFAWER